MGIFETLVGVFFLAPILFVLTCIRLFIAFTRVGDAQTPEQVAARQRAWEADSRRQCELRGGADVWHEDLCRRACLAHMGKRPIPAQRWEEWQAARAKLGLPPGTVADLTRSLRDLHEGGR